MSTNPPPVPPSAPPSMPPSGQPYPYPAYQAPAPKKGVSPLVWILGGLGVLVMLVLIVVAGSVYFIANKAHQAGFDASSIRKNPALATIRMMAAMNPDIDVVSYDDDKGYVTVREKNTGKTYTVNFEDAKKGKFVFSEDGKAPVTITAHGDGSSGTIEVKDSDGSIVKIGGGGPAKVPAWVPDYPGSEPQGAFSAQSGDGSSGSFVFKTKDPIDKVVKFYEEGFKQMGMKTTSTLTNADGKTGGGILSAEVDKKSVVVLLGSDDGQTGVNVTFTAKK